MGQCLIINIQQILDNSLNYVQTSYRNLEATIASTPRNTENLTSPSFHFQHRQTSRLELERCVDLWDHISWFIPSKPVHDSTIQITWHRLAVSKSSDVQFMSLQFSLPLSVSMNQASGNTLKLQGHALGGPDFPSDLEMCQKRLDIVQSQLLSDKRCGEVTTRRSSLCTYPPHPEFPLNIDHNTGQRAATSDTTSRTSRSRDSDERAPVDSGNTVTSFFSMDEIIQDPRPLCETAPVDTSGQPDVVGRGADESGEVNIPTDTGDQRLRYPFLNPVSEYQANLDAVSPECKELFLEATNAQCEDDETDSPEDDSVDTYWAWSQEKQQWFHEDTDCNTIVWFPKNFD
ncbi:hypothetical protein F4809DRAFT_658320 [Biscogniauxia mediterranea]|nr:hypothetical protein F4809DRAFT_658320 [Biscogniauxia mediterranea]